MAAAVARFSPGHGGLFRRAVRSVDAFDARPRFVAGFAGRPFRRVLRRSDGHAAAVALSAATGPGDARAKGLRRAYRLWLPDAAVAGQQRRFAGAGQRRRLDSRAAAAGHLRRQSGRPDRALDQRPLSLDVASRGECVGPRTLLDAVFLYRAPGLCGDLFAGLRGRGRSAEVSPITVAGHLEACYRRTYG